MAPIRPPTRFVHVAEATARFGARAAALGEKMTKGDPLLDAALDALSAFPPAERERLLRTALDDGISALPSAPKALAALFAQLDAVPTWVDRARRDRGGALYLAAGPMGELVLGMSSLVLAFASPAGNKPLFLSGRLRENAQKRLVETKRYVEATSRPGGMERFEDGFKATVRVRFIHGHVRAMLTRSPKWNAAAWGAPINQADMATSALLFSLVVLDGLRRLGLRIATRDAEDMIHLWRYVGYVIGVDDDLLGATEADARALWELFAMTQDAPDADARALASALIEVPLTVARTPAERAAARVAVRVGYAASRLLLGDELADGLAYPRSRLRYAFPLLRPAVRVGHRALTRVPGGWPAVVRRVNDPLGHGRSARDEVHALFAMPGRLFSR